MQFQNWILAKNVIPNLDLGQKLNSKIGLWPKIEFQNWTLNNEIPILDPGQKWNSKIRPFQNWNSKIGLWPKMEFQN